MIKNNETTILIIDDEAAIRESYSDYLEDQEYRTIIAENGRVGLEIFDPNKVDLVLIDLRMPEVDGLEVLTTISKDSPATPLIVISGTGMIEDAIEALHRGAWDYLLKPIESLEILKHVIEMNLEKMMLKNENKEYQDNLEKLVKIRTDELETALNEKNILIQDIHHRVKNNHSQILSIISMECNRFIKNADTINPKNIFESLENRILMLSTLYTELYTTNQNVSQLNAEDYFTHIITIIKSVNDENKKFDLEMDILKIDLPLKFIIPLGLIINEIFSNIYKHAFPESKKNKVIVSLKKQKEKSLLFSIEDNGCGFNKPIEKLKENTLGIKLMEIFASQIKGTLSITSKNGSKYELSFNGE